MTIPEVELMVATEGVLLVHETPPELLRVVVDPTHTDVVPVIAAGAGFTVTSLVL